ncbi:pseudoazurin [Sphingomicrobium sediminis]|uniref:Pseudoazurin n=1 Tax=Sphingomicrobium sediminis TaxID=2950949 RepID=A0A9X2J3S6_9SPHN|nr:pseudoazurin [Sphingomicrobium sediminis]MCM8556497.1 pseudoazurin [Sphingomicrobium sediminis]
MKTSRALIGSAAIAALMATAACGSRADEEPPAPAPTEEAGEDTATEEDTASAPATEPEVEPNGTVIEIQMLTRDPDGSGLQVFKPDLIRAQVGDTIRFVPTDPTHQSSSIEGMVPDGARGWEGEINEAVEYVVPLPGVYGYQCVPHYAAGMVGLIIVEGDGQDSNVEAAKAVSHPGNAGRKFEAIFEEAGL